MATITSRRQPDSLPRPQSQFGPQSTLPKSRPRFITPAPLCNIEPASLPAELFELLPEPATDCTIGLGPAAEPIE